MKIIDEKTKKHPEKFEYHPVADWKHWFEISTEIVGRGTSDQKDKLLIYLVHTYPTTKVGVNYPNSEIPKHYVVEITLNGEFYVENHLSYLDKSPHQRTLDALAEHIRAVNIIRENGPRTILDRYNLE